MEEKLQVWVMLAMALSLLSAASAKPGLAYWHSLSYYPAACAGFDNSGSMTTGVGDELWDNGRACGQMLTVKCTGSANGFPKPCKDGVVTVKVVDYCQQPCDVNLSWDAFSSIANPDAGSVRVDYS
ncbi:EG45-like domain containing protein [Eucalyptus grandis]|uniref:Uncharacterized protein n=2 Tax=Eucalyptus grandis TaxID=71139 RepID=A0ACC3L9X3_EUCGR|nr:EG45-like domain containing protein [Eucalyptus grandis]KAK3435518.1 hypothetical protein EUGRSUZ_C00205 [Eucalyptus grandis]